MSFASVNGIDIYYELHGEGPPLLYISGTGGDLRSPAVLLPVIGSFETLAYDQRGLGQTSKPDGDYSMADYADDAAALVRSMGWEHCHVMGVSFGGMVALNLAQRHPELINRLVLCCTSAGGVSASYPLHELGDLNPADAFATRMRLIDRRWDPAADEPIPGLGAYYDQMVAGMAAARDPDALAGLRQQLAARARHDVTGALSSIEHRTLVCAGRYDDIAPLANSEYLAERLPNADLRVFDGGHIFMIQDRSVRPAIDEFLANES